MITEGCLILDRNFPYKHPGGVDIQKLSVYFLYVKPETF